jgi:hypothetical protein
LFPSLHVVVDFVVFALLVIWAVLHGVGVLVVKIDMRQAVWSGSTLLADARKNIRVAVDYKNAFDAKTVFEKTDLPSVANKRSDESLKRYFRLPWTSVISQSSFS